jgi:hypothetical protein
LLLLALLLPLQLLRHVTAIKGKPQQYHRL